MLYAQSQKRPGISHKRLWMACVSDCTEMGQAAIQLEHLCAILQQHPTLHTLAGGFVSAQTDMLMRARWRLSRWMVVSQTTKHALM